MHDFKKIRKLIISTFAIFLIGSGVYVAFQLYTLLRPTYVFEIAIKSTLLDSVFSNGYVVFEETYVTGSGNLSLTVQEGERVSQGQSIAEIFESDAQLTASLQIKEIENDIALLQESQKVDNTKVSTLISQRSSSLYDVLDALDSKNYNVANTEKDDYILTQNKIDILTGEQVDFTQQIANLTAQKDILISQISGTQTVIAPSNGYFISSNSGQFLTEQEKTAKDIPLSEFEQMINSENQITSSENIGKIVSSYTWQFVGACTLEESERFAVGDELEIAFPDKNEEIYPTKVVSVEVDESTGFARVVLQCEYVSENILSLGFENAQIIFETYEGLRIPQNSIRITQVDDPEIVAQTGDSFVEGVYVKNNNIFNFVPIEKVYENEDYVLVPYQTITNAKEGLKLYDEVLISNDNVTDGMLL